MSSAFILPEPNLSSSKRDSFNNTRRPFTSSSSHSHHHRTRSLPFTDLSLTLTRRSRLTNLGVVVLLVTTIVSILLNISYHFSFARPRFGFMFRSYNGPTTPNSILSTIGRQTEFKDLNHLIIVPGHAIWNDGNPEKVLDDDEWQLEEYQRGGGRVNAFVEHIKRGAELAVQDEHSLLVFSGGQTRQNSTTTEADSYLLLALRLTLFPPQTTAFHRSTTERHALDSYQNLLFSLARFHEYTGRYPEKITVVGYAMKKRRYQELHAMAIKWPSERMEYIGIDASGDTEAAMEGERTNAYLPYTKDLYGCHPPLLTKRRARNLYSRFHPYHTSAPELASLLDWCPDEDWTDVYDGWVPWNDRVRRIIFSPEAE